MLIRLTRHEINLLANLLKNKAPAKNDWTEETYQEILVKLETAKEE